MSLVNDCLFVWFVCLFVGLFGFLFGCLVVLFVCLFVWLFVVVASGGDADGPRGPRGCLVLSVKNPKSLHASAISSREDVGLVYT